MQPLYFIKESFFSLKNTNHAQHDLVRYFLEFFCRNQHLENDV
jgi:hypothetical protein